MSFELICILWLDELEVFNMQDCRDILIGCISEHRLSSSYAFFHWIKLSVSHAFLKNPVAGHHWNVLWAHMQLLNGSSWSASNEFSFGLVLEIRLSLYAFFKWMKIRCFTCILIWTYWLDMYRNIILRMHVNQIRSPHLVHVHCLNLYLSNLLSHVYSTWDILVGHREIFRENAYNELRRCPSTF